MAAIRTLFGIAGGSIVTVTATMLHPILKPYYLPVPVPVKPVSILGGMTDMCLKGIGSMPYLKETCVVAALVAGTYGLTRNGKVREKMEDGVWRLKERFGKKMKEKISRKANDVIPESIRDESRELDSALPKIQVKVGNIESGEFVVYGSAVRIADSIVVPSHVLNSAKDDRGFVYLKGSKGVVKFSVDSFVIIETDLEARPTTSDDFSLIGMPQVKLAECLSDRGEFVSICGVRGKGTVGNLKHDRTSFGKVMYSGTTMPGYSGAPYMVGSAVSGIHCWGGKVNGGYSASYVKVLIHKQIGKVEETDIWLMEKFQQKAFGKNDIRFNPGSDEAWVRYKGQYHIVSGDTFRRSKGFDYLEEFENHDSMKIEESLLNSGEFKSRMSPGASGNVKEPGDLEQLVATQLMKKLSELSLTQFKKLKNSNALSTSEENMNGLLSEPKQK